MFLDIALGIFSAIFVGLVFDFQPTSWFFVVGILITVLPDADFLYFFLKQKRDKDRKSDYKHRDYIHYPLIYLLLGTSIFYFILGKEWALLFSICSFFHFLHDSIAVGWGIKWLYPFSKNRFAFFYLYSKQKKGGLRKLIFSFNEENIGHYIREHGDKDWLKNIYYKWHLIAIVELLGFIISLIFLLLYFY